MLKNDIFKISTFLDPYHGINYIAPEERSDVLRRLKLNLHKVKEATSIQAKKGNDKKIDKVEAKRKESYVNYDEEESEPETKTDCLDTQINDHLALIKCGNKKTCSNFGNFAKTRIT